jgi:hypothetical protein
MKIIIEYDGVKREIEGPFNICGSAADLRSLSEQLRGFDPDASYGWMSIRTTEASITPNQPPIGWHDPVRTSR